MAFDNRLTHTCLSSAVSPQAGRSIADHDLGVRRVGARPDFLESVLDDVVHINSCGFDGFAPQPRERQEIIDEMFHLLAAVANDLQQPARLVVELVPIVLLEDAGETVYRAQGRAQVVRNRIAEAFQLLVGRLEFVGANLQVPVERLKPLFEPACDP